MSICLKCLPGKRLDFKLHASVVFAKAINSKEREMRKVLKSREHFCLGQCLPHGSLLSLVAICLCLGSLSSDLSGEVLTEEWLNCRFHKAHFKFPQGQRSQSAI